MVMQLSQREIRPFDLKLKKDSEEKHYLCCSVLFFCLMDHTDQTIAHNQPTLHKLLHIAPYKYHCTKALTVYVFL